MNSTPTPGSSEARARGCKCPVLDNNHGAGIGIEGCFVTRDDCPIHGEPETAKEEDRCPKKSD